VTRVRAKQASLNKREQSSHGKETLPTTRCTIEVGKPAAKKMYAEMSGIFFSVFLITLIISTIEKIKVRDSYSLHPEKSAILIFEKKISQIIQ
jgi:hypothetical protein